MANGNNWHRLLFSFNLLISSVLAQAALQGGGVMLYTPYTRISVPPGESITYTIDVINISGRLETVDLSISGVPRGWNSDLQSGGYYVSQISVLPDEKKALTLKVDVPLVVNKGTYRLRLMAGANAFLNLVVVVTEQGTFKTEFTAQQSNIQGHTSSSFTYNATLRNRTAERQVYALSAKIPQGWNAIFKANYIQVASVDIEPNSSKEIIVEIRPAEMVQAGTYKIPVTAVSNATSAGVELEAVILGSFNMELTTPRGLLSTNITAGDTKRLELLLKNTGSATMSDIEFEFTAPLNWDVTFDPKIITVLHSGNETRVFASLKADRKAIAGDYLVKLRAMTTEKTSEISVRVSVETPLLWGWVGVLIIMLALGSVYYLFRKFGRR